MAWRVVSRPALALPSPTGTAAKPRHCPRAPQRSPAAARGHHRGLARRDFWPISCVLLQTSSIGGVFRVAFYPVVTDVVNPTAFSLKIVVFGRRLTTFVTGVLTRGFKLLRFDDVCNGYCPRVPQPGPVGQADRLSETAIAFAGAGRVATETGIAFAGEKWVYLVRFSAVLVTVVSTVAVQGRAVVMAVSYWPVSAVAVVSVVSMSPWCRASRAKQFALRAQNTPKSANLRSLGEFFAETRLERLCWANFFAPIGPVLVLDIARRTSGWLRWGFCSIRSWLAVYRRRVAALMMQFPPFGGGEAVVQGGVAPKSQTTSVKNAGEGCGGRGGLRFGGIDRCRGALFARHPPNMRLNLLLRTAQHVEASIA